MGAPPVIGPADLFAGGPPLKLQFRVRLITPDDLRVARRAVLFVLVTWVPLVVLAAVEGNLLAAREGGRAFLADFGAAARYLVAGPLLIASEGRVHRRAQPHRAALPRPAARAATRRFALPGGDRHVEAPARRPLAEVAVALAAFALSAAAIMACPRSPCPRGTAPRVPRRCRWPAGGQRW
jgi:hypothetical protein